MRIEGVQEVRGIVRQHPNTAPVFDALGIDYCCEGGLSLEQVCRDHNLALDKVISDLSGALEAEPAEDDRHWMAVPLGALSDLIVARHHRHAKRELPRLAALAAKVHMRHGHLHPELHQLCELVDTMALEMSNHMLKEEQVLFPRVKRMESTDRAAMEPLAQPIRRMLDEHEDTGELLRSIRSLTHNYKLPEDACMSYKALYDGLSAFEAETHWHVHLENNVLFPRALDLEKTANAAAGR